MILETERLWIRPITPEDKYEIFGYRRDKETNQYQGWIPETIEEVEAFIGKVSTQINVPGTWFQLVMIEKETQKIVGDIGIHFIDSENQQAEIGCTINKEYQNRGFATESIKAVIDYLFNQLKKHRIIASIDPDNKNSVRLVERIGFRKEAHFIQSVWINGKWADDLIYALLEKEWKEIKSNASTF